MSISRKLAGVLKPNALIGRTVWSTPQGIEKRACFKCKDWVPLHPDVEYDPGDQGTFENLTMGMCSNLRIMAAYKKVPTTRSFYVCNFYSKKEKEDGR